MGQCEWVDVNERTSSLRLITYCDLVDLGDSTPLISRIEQYAFLPLVETDLSVQDQLCTG